MVVGHKSLPSLAVVPLPRKGTDRLCTTRNCGAKPTYTSAIKVLFVCTGNICRSPVAAAALAARLGDGRWEVTSAGTQATLGRSPAEVVAAAAARDLDVTGHLSRQVTADMVEAADVVVGMAREHVREVSVLAPGAFAKTFTMREFVRRITDLPSMTAASDDPVVSVGAGRTTAAFLSAGPTDDVADPYGGPRSGYDTMVADIEGLVGPMARWIHTVAEAAR